MTLSDFKNEFNYRFDHIASNQAPALDDYEISVALTRAQEQLVKEKFREFETSTKVRNDLKNLLKHYNNSLEQELDKNIVVGSQFFVVPSDMFLIAWEGGVIQNTDCNNELQTVDVKPITLDEYNIQKRNPFKKPYKSLVWRLDYTASAVGNNIVELISEYPVDSYSVRYIKRPTPIILSDLTALEVGLSIEGLSAATTCELDDSVHSEIVDRAVELATMSFKENNLQNNVQLNTRNQ